MCFRVYLNIHCKLMYIIVTKNSLETVWYVGCVGFSAIETMYIFAVQY